MGRLSYRRGITIWGLVYLLTLNSFLTPPLYAPDENAPGVPTPQLQAPLSALAARLEAADATTPPPKVAELDLEASQYHRIFAQEGDTSKVVREIPLAQLDLGNPMVSVTNFDREVLVYYDKENKELSFIRMVKDSKSDKRYPSDAHVYKNVEITSNIISDPNFYLFATSVGIRAILVKDIRKHFCQAPVLAPVAVIPNSESLGFEMTHLEWLNRAARPRGFTNSPDFIEGGDIAVTVTAPDKEQFEHTISRHEIIMNLRMRLLGALARMVVVSPDLELSEAIATFMKENATDLQRYQAQQEELLRKSGTNDATNHALTTLALREDMKSLLSLFKKEGGQDAFERLATAPRDRFSADPSATAPWQSDFLAIQEGLTADANKAPGEQRSWRQILIDKYTEGNGAQALAGAEAEGNMVAKIWDRVSGLWETYGSKRNLTLLGAVVAGVAINSYYEGVPTQWALATLTDMLKWSTEAPVISSITSPIQKSLAYFSDGWRITRWVGGTLAICSFYYISVWAGKTAAYLRGHPEWSGLRTFFNYGIKFYGRICYPVQKLAWDALRQRNLYVALDHGLSPLKNRAAWNAPWASEAQIQQNAQELGRTKQTEATLRSRAMLIAAAIVSRTEEREGNRIDLATLIMAGQGKQIEAIAELASSTDRVRWTEIMASVYAGLTELGEKAAGPLDATLITEYHKIMKQHALQIRYERQHGTPLGKKLNNTLNHLWDQTSAMFSQNILPFVMFGKQGYDNYRLFKGAEISDNTALIAGEAYMKDYLLSGGLYGAMAAKKFGDVLTLGPHAWEVITNQLSQVFIYGVQGAIDPMTGEVIDPLSNPNKPLSDLLFADRRVREQSLAEGLKMVLNRMTDPNDTNPLTQHSKYMENTLTGLQVRFGADYLTRTLGLLMTPTAAGAVPLTVGGAFVSAAPLSLYFLLAKISLAPGALGYAVIWPYVHLAMRHLEETPQKNLIRLQAADYFIETGIRLSDTEMMRQGVRVLQDLYKEGKIEIPERFRVEPEKFNAEMAARFHELSLEKIPLPTKASHHAINFVNVGLAVGLSNLLFDAASSVAYDPNVEPMSLLAKTVGWFGATYVGLKFSAPLYNRANAAVRAGFSKAQDLCRWVMGRTAME